MSESETPIKKDGLKDAIKSCPDCSLYESDGPLTTDLVCEEHMQDIESIHPHTVAEIQENFRTRAEHNIEQRRNNRAAIATALFASICIGGLSAIYLSRYFTGWGGQILGGAFIWGLLSLVLFLVLGTGLRFAGVVKDAA